MKNFKYASIVLCCPALLNSANAVGPGLVFTNITESTGIAFTDRLTESLAWGDYDNDGDQDLYLTVNGPNVLMRNDGGGVFTDVTAKAGVGSETFSVGTAFGDLDNDGDLDLYFVVFGGGLDSLYMNNGDGTFTDIAASAGINEESSSRGMAFLDFDGDGLLDIYVNAIGPDILYHNQGGMQFVNVAGELDIGVAAASGTGVGVCPTHIDSDNQIDIFTGNRSGDTNWLFHNLSTEDAGSFEPFGAANGITQVGLGMGVLSLDIDNDLDMDLYWTSWPESPNALYENIDGSTFVDIASETGTLDPLGWGISCNAADIDNDGFEDFFVTNGFSDTTTPNVLFQNTGAGAFIDASASLPGGTDFDGRGVAFADFDNDGDMDLVVTADAGEPNQFWRNDTGTPHTWVAFDLEGSCANRSAIGARVVVNWLTPDGLKSVIKEVSGGAGRGSFNSLPVEFGMSGDSNTIESVSITWYNGSINSFLGSEIALNSYNHIVERLYGEFSEPYGVFNFFDVSGFIAAYTSNDPSADLDLTGTIDFFDISAFLSLFQDGCPND